MSDDGVSPRWQRINGGHELPHGVTLLSLPWVGATWYDKGPGYWRGRVVAVIIIGGTGAIYGWLYQFILSDIVRRSGYHTEFWVTAACMAALTLFGALGGNLTAAPLRLLALISYILAPGLYLGGLIRQLLPTPPDERVAKADLARQLAEHRHRR
jgi:hypothetical protein